MKLIERGGFRMGVRKDFNEWNNLGVGLVERFYEDDEDDEDASKIMYRLGKLEQDIRGVRRNILDLTVMVKAHIQHKPRKSPEHR